MIKRLVLKNFQIHENLVIEPSDGFSVIEGDNDSGKSSIVRALYWLFFNEPSGDWMCRIDEQGKQHVSSVKVVFADGNIIKRVKGDGINKYVVNENEFENFGYSIPQQVLEVLKIYPFTTNKEEFKIHISMQDDKPFLIHESAPVKASVIDSLTGVSLLQKTITEFNKESFAVGKEISNAEERITEIEKEVKEIPDLEVAEKKINEVRKLSEKIESLKVEQEKLRKFGFDLYKYHGTINSIIIPIENTDKLKEKQESIISLSTKIESLRLYKTRLEKFAKVQVVQCDTSKIESLRRQCANVEQFLQMLKGFGDKRTRYYDNHYAASEELRILETDLKEEEKKAKVCPTCGRPL